MTNKNEIETLIEEALEILDHAELEHIDGGVKWDESCPAYPKPGEDGGPPDFGGYLPMFRAPIIFC